MSTVNFEELYDDLKSGVETVAKDSLQEYETEAKSDGQQALANIKSNLQGWAQEVENGSLTFEDLSFLLKEEQGLDEMISLKQAGLAAVEIDKFRNGLINMVISTVTGFIKV